MTDPIREIFDFPCVFPLKAMGYNTDEFEVLVVHIVRRHAPDLADHAVSRRFSANGKYRSVTATFMARSRAQLDALYAELSAHEQVLMLL
jgi:hypothetical protein